MHPNTQRVCLQFTLELKILALRQVGGGGGGLWAFSPCLIPLALVAPVLATHAVYATRCTPPL